MKLNTEVNPSFEFGDGVGEERWEGALCTYGAASSSRVVK